MQRAILYIRVSTDEQADKGFSLASQEEQLRKYCQSTGIGVIHLFREDHSAKTFERPEFKKMLTFCKQNSKDVDLLLFVKWDRFSRNTRDSYQMIHQFQKLGIETRAVEQPLDLNVPESKIMLAIYLASPEVENDRRALNVFNGMRKAKKEGRYVGTAPMGYINARDDRNRPIIKPNAIAQFIRTAFEEMATGMYAQEELRRIMVTKGFECSRNNFNRLLHNPLYAGNIYIAPFKDEPGCTVKGNHEPIISENLFQKVQAVIARSTPINTAKNTGRVEFPLRGLLKCCKCGKSLTGSSGLSKSGRRYFYYHCTKGCKEIYATEKVHKAFLEVLDNISSRHEVVDLYGELLRTSLAGDRLDNKGRIKKLEEEIEVNKERISKAMQMMLDGQLEAPDYKAIKVRYENSNTLLLKECALLSDSGTDRVQHVNDSVNLLLNISNIYQEATVENKKRLVCLNFPEKLVFENGRVQTPKTNEFLSLIMLDPSNLRAKKMGRSKNFLRSSHMVRP